MLTQVTLKRIPVSWGVRNNLARTHSQSTHGENKYQTKSLSDWQFEFPDDWHWEKEQNQVGNKIVRA